MKTILVTLFFIQCLCGNSLAARYARSTLTPEMGECIRQTLRNHGRENIKMEQMDAFALMDVRTGRIFWILNPKVLSSFDFQPGSIFKVITAYAALTSGKVDIHQVYECRGDNAAAVDRPGKNSNSNVKCWLKKGHGRVDLARAMAYSCNLYFAHLGLGLQAKDLMEAAHVFGLGSSTGSDIPGEVPGALPIHVDAGDKGKFAIGQGRGVFVTGLQVLSMAAAVANDGLLLSPVLAQAEKNHAVQRGVMQDLDALAFIRAAMVQASQFGTGKEHDLYGLRLAGKTGTAQWRSLAWKTHGWFMGFWPIDRPTLAVVAFVHDGNGSNEAAALAKTAIEVFMAAQISCFLDGSLWWRHD